MYINKEALYVLTILSMVVSNGNSVFRVQNSEPDLFGSFFFTKGRIQIR